MELIELHVRKLRSRFQSQCKTVACRYFGIRSIAIHLTLLRPMQSGRTRALIRHRSWLCTRKLRRSQFRTDHAAIFHQQLCHHRPFGKPDAWVRMCIRHQRSTDLRAGGIAIGMENARPGMRALPRPQQSSGFVVKVGAPLDQFGNALWPFADQNASCRLEYESVSG